MSDSSVLVRWEARANEFRPKIIAESVWWRDFKSDPAETPREWHGVVKYVYESFFPSAPVSC